MTAGLAAALIWGSGGVAYAAPSVDQELPFPCGERWAGSTRASHSPSFWSIDFNAADDFGKPVVASAAGHVYRVNDVGDTSYGKYVFIDHGNGESTVYAHLSKFLVQEGAYVDQGEVIGLLGNSGGSYGAHLHYEQRYGSSVGQPFFHQYPFVYDRELRSQNCANAPLTGDWDGDGTSDRGVFARGAQGVFRVKVAPKQVQRVALGSATDQVVAGDWDGDGRDGVAARDALSRTVVLRGLDGQETSRRFAPRTAQLLAGDFDGDGRDTLAFYRPKAGMFVMPRADKKRTRVRWGGDGSLPLVGDWDGDGLDDVGSFDPAAAEFSLRVIDPGTGQPFDVRVPVTGPVEKDVEQDPVTDPDPVTGQVEVEEPTDPEADPAPDPTLTDPEADPAEPETAEAPPTTPEPAPEPEAFELNTETDLASALLPAVGDWDGDGRDDLGLWDPATATWTSWVVNSLERRAAAARSQKFGRPRY
ncbi:peptidoglycan DD-metalloendopeptidase family protein [Nocardioidaceae bacterium]|nr:peptidoglycan DD-metalloendopeptidase family protein [Nocardioidaceae bacterium]